MANLPPEISTRAPFYNNNIAKISETPRPPAFREDHLDEDNNDYEEDIPDLVAEGKNQSFSDMIPRDEEEEPHIIRASSKKLIIIDPIFTGDDIQ